MQSFLAELMSEVYHELHAGILKKLDFKKATGPDRISAIILKMLICCIVIPLIRLCRRLLIEGHWPNCWQSCKDVSIGQETLMPDFNLVYRVSAHMQN